MRELKLNNVIETINGNNYDAVANINKNGNGNIDKEKPWYVKLKVPEDLFDGHHKADWKGKEIKFRGKFESSGTTKKGIACGIITHTRKVKGEIFMTIEGSGEYKLE